VLAGEGDVSCRKRERTTGQLLARPRKRTGGGQDLCADLVAREKGGAREEESLTLVSPVPKKILRWGGRRVDTPASPSPRGKDQKRQTNASNCISSRAGQKKVVRGEKEGS